MCFFISPKPFSDQNRLDNAPLAWISNQKFKGNKYIPNPNPYSNLEPCLVKNKLPVPGSPLLILNLYMAHGSIVLNKMNNRAVTIMFKGVWVVGYSLTDAVV